MAKPVILTVDDEEQVRNAVERDLKRRYRKDYRIIKAGSGAEGLDTAHRLKQRNDSIALFLVDQRMPEMTGTEFLAEARSIYPEARKVLLTAYADTEATGKPVRLFPTTESGSPAPCGPRARMRSRISWPAARSPTSSWTSSETRRPARWWTTRTRVSIDCR